MIRYRRRLNEELMFSEVDSSQDVLNQYNRFVASTIIDGKVIQFAILVPTDDPNHMLVGVQWSDDLNAEGFDASNEFNMTFGDCKKMLDEICDNITTVSNYAKITDGVLHAVFVKEGWCR